MRYTAIIRTKNSDKTIRSCIESLLTQTIPPAEIIVIDSGSKDSTLEIVKNYHVKVLYYPKDKPFNYSIALNLGIRESMSEFILIISSHVRLLYNDSVKIAYDLLNEEMCKAVSYYRSDKETQYNESVNPELKRIDGSNFEGQAMFNFCSLIKKSSWQEYSFNERISACEDQDWAYHFIKQGYHTVFVVNPVVHYKNPYYINTKDAKDIVTIGRTVYPYWVSKSFMYKTLKDGIRKLKKGETNQARRQFTIFWFILKYRLFGFYSKQSAYNKRLK